MATIAMLAASAAIMYVLLVRGDGQPPESTFGLPDQPLDIADAKLKGSPSAHVVVLEFADFQCPFCAKFANSTLPQLIQRYVDAGEVLLGFRHLPLDKVHPLAVDAAAAAECAAAQGEFWRMHDLLFRDQAKLDRLSLNARAQVLGLELGEFGACMDTVGRERVRADTAVAEGLGVRSTPFFLVGWRNAEGRLQVSKSLKGAQPFNEFAAVIEELLARTRRR